MSVCLSVCLSVCVCHFSGTFLFPIFCDYNNVNSNLEVSFLDSLSRVGFPKLDGLVLQLEE